MIINYSKETLRLSLKKKLSLLLPEEKKQIEKRMHTKLWNSELWEQAKIIGITIAQGYEWDTASIIYKAWEQGKQVVVPKCYPNNKEMIFYYLRSYNQLEKVYYQLLEPNPDQTSPIERNDIDLLIVPGLVFDHEHYRIGHGGGYYDRFLENYSGTTLSLVWTEQLVETIPVQSFDIAIDHLLIQS